METKNKGPGLKERKKNKETGKKKNEIRPLQMLFFKTLETKKNE
jgi:hypothetical protein